MLNSLSSMKLFAFKLLNSLQSVYLQSFFLMNQCIKYLGVDINKYFFDVCHKNKTHYQFANSISGFKKLLKLVD